MADVLDKCGVAAIYLKKSKKGNYDLEVVPQLLYVMLSNLQHRGQLSTGISTYNPFNEDNEIRLKLLKDVGDVDAIYKVTKKGPSLDIIKYCKGISGIGHVRYATSGSGEDYLTLRREAQPMLRHHGRASKRFCIGFNGNIANYDALAKQIMDEGYILDTKLDTEAIMHLISLSLKRRIKRNKEGYNKPNLLRISEDLMGRLDGAYNITAQFADGNLLVIRDPLGFKPFVWGENEDFYAAASESVALESIGISNFKIIEPGSCLILNTKKPAIKKLVEIHKRSYCHFEYVYFADVNSILDCGSVNKIRENLGFKLASIEPLKDKFKNTPSDYVVVPVPNTAIPAAEVYAWTLGIPSRSAIVKTKGSRGFINKLDEREQIMYREYKIIKERIKGRKVILIDDSIVRGETSKLIVGLVKNAGATEVHLRSTEPPLISPCFYGIDFPTYRELIAARYPSDKLEEQVANYIGADSVKYQTLDGLVDAIGTKSENLCSACITGQYPTEAGKHQASESLSRSKL